jgi:hypothetical protein
MWYRLQVWKAIDRILAREDLTNIFFVVIDQGGVERGEIRRFVGTF